MEVGGVLSGEHGIGLEKQESMPLMFTDADMQAMAELRPSFATNNMFNPGKIFPTGSSCLRHLPGRRHPASRPGRLHLGHVLRHESRQSSARHSSFPQSLSSFPRKREPSKRLAARQSTLLNTVESV